MRRFLIILIIVILVLAALGGFGVFLLTQTGAGLFGLGGEELRQWIGKQVTAIVNDNLKPELSFDRLEYEFPGAVTVFNPALVTTPEEGSGVDPITVVSATTMVIELAETPRVGEPIVIQSVILDSPVVRLIEMADGGLAAFSDLLEDKPGEKKEEGSTDPSDVFAIRLIEIRDGTLVYEPNELPTMKLDELNFDLNNKPGNEKGWYAIDVILERPQVFTFDIDGRLNIDSRILEISEGTTFDVQLETGNYDVLPPQLQSTLETYGIRGALTANVNGRIPFEDVMESSLALDLQLEEGHFATEAIELPLRTMNLSATMEEGTIDVSRFKVQALDGSAEAEALISLAGEQASSLSLWINDMELEELLRATTEDGGQPKYAGRIRADVNATMDVANPLNSINGTGGIEVDRGRLVDIPVIGRIVRLVRAVVPQTEPRKDRLETDLTFKPGEVKLTDLHMVSSTVAARGDGTIGYDGSLNLALNAGPREKVQSKFGELGDFIGGLTDKLVKYHVTGTVSQPKVDVKPLGIGVN